MSYELQLEDRAIEEENITLTKSVPLNLPHLRIMG